MKNESGTQNSPLVKSLPEAATDISRKFGWRIIFGLLAISGFLIFFGWLAEEVFEGDTKNFDDFFRNLVSQIASPSLTNVMKFFSFLGLPLVLTILGTIIVIAFFYLKHKRAVGLFLITMAGEIVLNYALKIYFAQTRPEPFFDYPLPLSYSFPSGHAFGALCFFGILARLTAARVQNKILKTVIVLSAIAIILLIGLSRIYLGVHYPSDVLAGYAAGLFWIGLISFVDTHQRSESDV